MLFGVLIGTIGYLAGNVTKGVAGSVMLSLGFTDHSYTDQAFERLKTTVTTIGGTQIKENTLQSTDVVYDYEKLLKMQQKWFNFFALSRGL